MRIGIDFGILILGAGICVSPAAGQLPNQGQQPANTSPHAAANDPLPGGATSENGAGTASSGDTMSHAQAQQMDKRFLQQISQNSLVGVQMGKLAQEKAASDAVKQFGSKMVQDHTRAIEIIKKVATRDGVPLNESLDAKHKERFDKLAKLSGAEFDRAYIKDQLKAHERMVSYYQNEADNGTESVAKKLATNMLPAVQDHLNSVKDLNKSLNATAMK